MAKWLRGGMQVATSVGLGLLVLDFTGLVTPGSVEHFGASFQAEGAILGLMADFRRAALIGMTGEAFTAPLADLLTRMKFAPGGSIICLERDRPVFEEHARLAAKYGVLRGVFTSAEEAEEWAHLRVVGQRQANLTRMRMSARIQAA